MNDNITFNLTLPKKTLSTLSSGGSKLHRDLDNNNNNHNFNDESVSFKQRAIKCPGGIFLGACKSVYNYEKVERIGQGTYGIVYKARDRSSGTTNGDEAVYALKRVRIDSDHSGIPINTIREIMLLKRLRHENVIRVKDIVVGGYSARAAAEAAKESSEEQGSKFNQAFSLLDSIFMVMEHCEYDMAYVMDNLRYCWSTREIKGLLWQLLSGVDYLHQNLVLHRDLKPSNLLIDQRGVLKIADFGISRPYSVMLSSTIDNDNDDFGDEEKQFDPKNAGNLAMTPGVVTLWYRAPELLLGEIEYGPAIDCWSVGCIFAEWIRNTPLFPGKSEQHQLTLIEQTLGSPSPSIWPNLTKLPLAPKFKFKGNIRFNSLKQLILNDDNDDTFVRQSENRASANVDNEEDDRGKRKRTKLHNNNVATGIETLDLLNRFLTYCPEKRISVSSTLEHEYFSDVRLRNNDWYRVCPPFLINSQKK